MSPKWKLERKCMIPYNFILKDHNVGPMRLRGLKTGVTFALKLLAFQLLLLLCIVLSIPCNAPMYFPYPIGKCLIRSNMAKLRMSHSLHQLQQDESSMELLTMYFQLLDDLCFYLSSEKEGTGRAEILISSTLSAVMTFRQFSH